MHWNEKRNLDVRICWFLQIMFTTQCKCLMFFKIYINKMCNYCIQYSTQVELNAHQKVLMKNRMSKLYWSGLGICSFTFVIILITLCRKPKHVFDCKDFYFTVEKQRLLCWISSFKCVIRATCFTFNFSWFHARLFCAKNMLN